MGFQVPYTYRLLTAIDVEALNQRVLLGSGGDTDLNLRVFAGEGGEGFLQESTGTFNVSTDISGKAACTIEDTPTPCPLSCPPSCSNGSQGVCIVG